MGTVGGMVNGVGGIVKDLPYQHLIRRDEAGPTLVSLSLGVLLSLLDYQASEAKDGVASTGGDPSTPTGLGPSASMSDISSSPTAVTNSFRYFLAKLVSTARRR